ncbi:hypothetical protein [Snodgrassella alvi]|nr:hypothetical protein [Snodgrassella alvi]
MFFTATTTSTNTTTFTTHQQNRTIARYTVVTIHRPIPEYITLAIDSLNP